MSKIMRLDLNRLITNYQYLVGFCIAFCAFVLLQPLFLTGFNSSLFFFLTLVLSLGLFFINNIYFTLKKFLLILLFLFLGLLASFINGNIFVTYPFIFILLLFIYPKSVLFSASTIFYNLILLTAFLTILSSILLNFFSIEASLASHVHNNHVFYTLLGINYIDNAYLASEFRNFVPTASIWDEPGKAGTIFSLFFLYTYFSGRKFSAFVFFVVSLLTMSLAAFFIIIYTLLFNIMTIRLFILLMSIVAVVFFSDYFLQDIHNRISNFSFLRFEPDFESFSVTLPLVIFGVEDPNSLRHLGQNLFISIFKFGIIFIITSFSIFLTLFLTYFKEFKINTVLSFLIIFCLVIYQRPILYELWFLIYLSLFSFHHKGRLS